MRPLREERGNPAAEGRNLTSLMKPSCTSSAASSGMFSSDRETGEREYTVQVRGTGPFQEPQSVYSGWEGVIQAKLSDLNFRGQYIHVTEVSA